MSKFLAELNSKPTLTTYMNTKFIKNAEEILSVSISKFSLIIETITNEQLKKAGANFYCTCPKCGKTGKGKGLQFKPNYNGSPVCKCFSCDFGTSNPINFIMEIEGLEYPEALKRAAQIVGVNIEIESYSKPKKKTTHTDTEDTGASFTEEVPKTEKAEVKKPLISEKVEDFIEEQLKGSGLWEHRDKLNFQVTITDKNETYKKEVQRYKSGRLIVETGEVTDGTDMILTYVNLNGEHVTYRKISKTRKEPYGPAIPFYRARNRFPEQNLDKDGKARKYVSPWSSGVQVWLPSPLIERYQKGLTIKHLYIDEGEKKADKSTIHGMYSVGIMGIHNIVQNKRLHPDFNSIIAKCQTEAVIFRVDADWQTKLGKGTKGDSVDMRARNFLAAVRIFQKYFNAFNANGSNIRIYFSYVKPNEQELKGVDDLLTHQFAGKEEELKADSEKAMIDGAGEGQYVNCIDITGMSDYKLQELFHLQSPDAFISYHREKIKEIGEEFYFSGTKYKLDESEKGYELAQPLAPTEIFWEKKFDKNNKDTGRFEFNFMKYRYFTKNRGIGFVTVKDYPRELQLIKADFDTRTIYKQTPLDIKRWTLDFLESAGEIEVADYLLKNTQLVNEGNIESLYELSDQISFIKNAKKTSYLTFANSFWEVGESGIKSYPLHTAPGFIYKEKFIDRKATLMENLFTIEKEAQRPIYTFSKQVFENIREFDFSNFLLNTGNYKPRDLPLSEWGTEDINKLTSELAHKMSAIGYLLHKFFDPSCAKLIYLTDGAEHEVGRSNGRSGKSLTALFCKQYVPVTDIDGKQPDLARDKNWLANVSPETGIVYFDDLHPHFPIERFFPPVTGVFQVRKMYQDTMQYDREDTPKFLVTANHGIRGLAESSSARDRVHTCTYSDYYNENYRPSEERNRLFFDEWDDRQNTLCDNFAAACIQTYLKHGLIEVPDERAARNHAISFIGQSLWLWLSEYFFTRENAFASFGTHNRVDRNEFYNKYITEYPKESKFLTSHSFKKKVMEFCKNNNLYLNFTHCIQTDKDGITKTVQDWGEDWKTGGTSYWFFHKKEEAIKILQDSIRAGTGDVPFRNTDFNPFNNDNKLPF